MGTRVRNWQRLSVIVSDRERSYASVIPAIIWKLGFIATVTVTVTVTVTISQDKWLEHFKKLHDVPAKNNSTEQQNIRKEIEQLEKTQTESVPAVLHAPITNWLFE